MDDSDHRARDRHETGVVDLVERVPRVEEIHRRGEEVHDRNAGGMKEGAVGRWRGAAGREAVGRHDEGAPQVLVADGPFDRVFEEGDAAREPPADLGLVGRDDPPTFASRFARGVLAQPSSGFNRDAGGALAVTYAERSLRAIRQRLVDRRSGERFSLSSPVKMTLQSVERLVRDR